MNNDIYPVDLAPLHTFKLPSKGRALLRLTEVSQCSALPADNDYYVLGGGSNVVFTENYERLIVKVEIKGITITESPDEWQIKVGAGENWHELVMRCLALGINGLENLALIPGTVGAAPVQNIGAYGVEVERYIHAVEVWDREQQDFLTLAKDACQFGYRDSIFKRHPERYLITQVIFHLAKAWQPVLSYGPLQSLAKGASAQDIAQRVIDIRQTKLPNPEQLPNAGSFFKNPVIPHTQYMQLKALLPNVPAYEADEGAVKVSAAYLIDQLGFKGVHVNDAFVHEQQALVLTNRGAATGSDLLALATKIQQQVLDHFGITLEVEVRLLGSHRLINI